MKSAKFLAIPLVDTGTQTGVVSVPLDRTKTVPIPRQSGTGTTHKKGVGICTEPSGTGTNASNNLVICVLTLLSLNSYTEGIGTLRNN